MCLAVPGKIVEINDTKAVVDFDGLKRKADISLLEDVKIGEYILVHVGFGIEKVDKVVAEENYRLLAKLKD